MRGGIFHVKLVSKGKLLKKKSLCIFFHVHILILYILLNTFFAKKITLYFFRAVNQCKCIKWYYFLIVFIPF